MYNKAGVITGLLVFILLITLPFWYGSKGRAPQLELPRDRKACVETTAYMRAHHVELLAHWRDSTVRDGNRVYKAQDGKEYRISLTGTCLGCHQKKAAFCDRCHTYMKVNPRCWDCHVAETLGKPGSGTLLQGRNIPAMREARS
jgi:hypothetical protein